MLVAEYIGEYLHRRGVTHVYEVIGGMITRLADAIHRQGHIVLIDVHHEQAAAFAADAAGRLSGIPGVAMATSGPGATNLLTGIGSCFYDSVPAVFITGQVNRNEQKGDRPIRQLGFQETDIVAMAQPVTKAAWQINDPAQVPHLLQKAFVLAVSGRPGPVLLDIPMDVQGAEIRGTWDAASSEEMPPEPPGPQSEELLQALAASRKPLVLAGGGIRSANALPHFRRLLDIIRVPVVHSLMAVDALPYQHPLRVGLIGTYGNRWANIAAGRSDFLLVLGSRLDIRQTGALVSAFQEGRTIYHVDIDEGEINNRVQGCRSISAHLRPFLERLADEASRKPWPDRGGWISEINELRVQWPDTRELQPSGINPNELMHELSRASDPASVYVTDVGNHQMWAAQSLELSENQRFITSGGMGSMGFALPAAVGAVLTTGQPAVMISGDGGMQLNIQELQTIRHHQLPVKMVVLNNQSLGMVRQFQESYFQGRYPGTRWGYSAPDFSEVARAYRIESHSVTESRSLPEALQKCWADSRAPFLLQVAIDVSANAYPKIAFGKPMTDMEPFAKPADLGGN
jgi:acetolactate synthase-1/2/3 large subunit